jgi:cell division protein FtsB
MNLENAIETLQADVASVADPKTKTILSGLLNLVEALYSENESLREENQQLKDEISRLKGGLNPTKVRNTSRGLF